MTQPTIWALVDCNNFYVSCERLFNPKLEGRPVVVLSNNDGCVVARSNEAKALGVHMGQPWFELEPSAAQLGIVALSSNYTLYGDLSNRVMALLATLAPRQEVYSIDECFLDFSLFPPETRAAHGKRIRREIRRQLGLPVCVGIGPTKTLAKLANACAKKGWAGEGGVCDLSTWGNAARDALLNTIPVDEVWGVGKRQARQLAAVGITTAGALAAADPTWVRRRFSVVLARTAQELRGEPALEWAEAPIVQKQLVVSRSFGTRVTSLETLGSALTAFATAASEKLRAHGWLAREVGCFLETNPFDPGHYYHPFSSEPLPLPCNDAITLAKTANRIAARLFRPGYRYKKAGVVLFELIPNGTWQPDLFTAELLPRWAERQQTMAALDAINRRFGRNTVTLAAAHQRGWQMRQTRRSPNYTTDWRALPVV
ncbi:MAG TPA: Y-family DNA polymerase [Hydrogenophilus thermoluteolus]|nr:Y-family DNA polymerase [Hydrogenophilus thermoluteolus]